MSEESEIGMRMANIPSMKRDKVRWRFSYDNRAEDVHTIASWSDLGPG